MKTVELVSKYNDKRIKAAVDVRGDMVELTAAQERKLRKAARLIEGDYFLYATDADGESYTVGTGY